MKFKIDSRKQVTKIELPTGGYLKVIKLEALYSVYIHGSKLIKPNRDITLAEANSLINKLLEATDADVRAAESKSYREAVRKLRGM